MGRKFLSVLLIGLAVFVFTATYFVWTVDGSVLNAAKLSGELRKAGVSSELSKLLPEIVAKDNKDSTPAEVAEMKDKISKVVTADYVDAKISAITSSFITFMKKGTPQPTLNIADFPTQLQVAGVEVKGDMIAEFSKPIQFNEEGKLDKLPQAYKVFSKVKYIGVALFALIMLAEWFVAEKGGKLKRVSRVFLYAGLWYSLYWLALIVVPGKFSANIKTKIASEDVDASGLVDPAIKAVQGLFSSYFLGFAVACLGVAVVLYIIRHLKHGDVLPPNTLSSKPSAKSPKKK